MRISTNSSSLNIFEKKYIKFKLAVILILAATLIIIGATLYFTYLGIVWTGITYNLKLYPDYLEFTVPTTETSSIFKDLVAGDRIIAVDGIRIPEINQPNNSNQDKLLFYPAQKHNNELSIMGKRLTIREAADKNEILLWAISAKTITLDISHSNRSPTEKIALLTNYNYALDNESSIEVNLYNLPSTNLKEGLTLVLTLTGLFFSAVGFYFFAIKPSNITFIYWLTNQLLCLELILSRISESYIGELEKVALVTSGGLLGTVFLHLMLLFPDGVALTRRSRIVLIVAYSTTLGIIILRNFIILTAQPTEALLTVDDIVRKVIRLALFLNYCVGLTLLAVKYFRSKGQTRLRIRLAVFAFIFGLTVPILAIAYYLVVSLWEPVVYNQFGLFLLPCIILPPLIGYAVVRNQLFGLTNRIRGFASYFLLTLLALATYFLLTVALVAVLPFWNEFAKDPLTVAILISFLCLGMYQFRSTMQFWIDKIFRFDREDYAHLVQECQYQLLKMTTLQEIFKEVIFEFPEKFHYDQAGLLILQSSVLELIEYQGFKDQEQKGHQLTQAILISAPANTASEPAADPELLDYKEFCLKQEYLNQFEKEHGFLEPDSFMSASSLEAIRPDLDWVKAIYLLRLENELYGFLLLGEKSHNFLPTDEERHHLINLAHQLTFSLHNVVRLVRERIRKEIYKQQLIQEENKIEKYALDLSGLIHDDIGQRLSTMRIVVSQMVKNTPEAFSPEVLQQVQDDLEHTIKSLRDVNSAIMPIREKESFVAALRELFDIKKKGYLLQHPLAQFDFVQPVAEWDLLDKSLEVEQKIALYRFFEEALGNAIKHSQATEITAVINFHSYGIDNPAQYYLEIEVIDNGRGMEDKQQLNDGSYLAKNQHFGVDTMRRRIEAIGGSLYFETAPGEGFNVRVVLSIQSTNSVIHNTIASNPGSHPALTTN